MSTSSERMGGSDAEELRRFFEAAAHYKDLLREIFVAVPVRPADGMAIHLAVKCSLWYGEGVVWQPLEDVMGGFIEIQRTKMVLDFLKNRSEKYLLMIDNDTEPPLGLPYILARHDAPVVGSPIASMGANGRAMLCFSREDMAGITRFVDFDDGDATQRIPATGLAEVPHCGTGAMLIRRDVLESFTFEGEDVPFFVQESVRLEGAKTGKMLRGEDVTFCNKVRAKGFKVYVDMEAHCGHRKTLRMAFPDHMRDPSLSVDKWVVSAKGMRLKAS